MTITHNSRTVSVTFPLREQHHIITVAEHDLLVSHPNHTHAVEFIRAQYALPTATALSIFDAVKATSPSVTHLADRKVEVRYPGETCTQDITYAEYNAVQQLNTVQATKFIRDQYSLGLYEAKKCVDTIKKAHNSARTLLPNS